MDTLDAFKTFVKANPTFASYIKDGSMTWQKFYELYDMYGEDSSIWNDFKSISKKLQDGVNSLSKAVGLFGELFKNNKEESLKEYSPRAIYQRFDD